MASAQRHGNDDFPEYDTSDTEGAYGTIMVVLFVNYHALSPWLVPLKWTI